MNRISIQQIILFFVYLLYQVLILQNVVLFHTAFCFLYVLYLLLLPVETNPLLLMVIGFLLGFAVDMFYQSLGLHAFSCVLMMYLRNYWLNSLTPQGGYDATSVPSLSMNGLQWFIVYAMPLIFVHHATLFFMEAGGFGMFWFTLWKIFTSTLFTTVVILIAQFLFPGRRR
ncbi:MAG TPA: Rod shape-determining protein MreD [Ohtaekwangia sp.]|nr:Rod shape-determining protein MreD [Ohtaekwangia sp.]